MGDDKKNADCVSVLGIPLWETDECATQRRNQRKQRQGQRQGNRNKRVATRQAANVLEAASTGQTGGQRTVDQFTTIAETMAPILGSALVAMAPTEAAMGVLGALGGEEAPPPVPGPEQYIIPALGLAAAAGIAWYIAS